MKNEISLFSADYVLQEINKCVEPEFRFPFMTQKAINYAAVFGFILDIESGMYSKIKVL